jgi:hypothetical protein
MNRINGKSFDVRILGFKIHFQSYSLSIDDSSTTAMDSSTGLPNGTLKGDVKGAGELVVDSSNMMLLAAAAKAAGSWQDIPTFPIDAYALGKSDDRGEFIHVHAYGCKMRISELLKIDPSNTDKTTHTLPYDVTGKDFVWINGVPYSNASAFDLF